MGDIYRWLDLVWRQGIYDFLVSLDSNLENKRLTEISSDQDSFEQASRSYQQALDRSGYNHKLQFKHPLNLTTKKKTRSRKRKII
jgi:hypothetical protein